MSGRLWHRTLSVLMSLRALAVVHCGMPMCAFPSSTSSDVDSVCPVLPCGLNQTLTRAECALGSFSRGQPFGSYVCDGCVGSICNLGGPIVSTCNGWCLPYVNCEKCQAQLNCGWSTGLGKCLAGSAVHASRPISILCISSNRRIYSSADMTVVLQHLMHLSLCSVMCVFVNC